jgi:hypothetical protein
LQAGIATDPRRLGDLPHEAPGLVGVHGLTGDHRARLPLAIVHYGAHEVVCHAHAVVGVLEEHRRVGGPGERAVVPGVDERPRLLLFLDLAIDELFDVRMVDVEDDHLRGAPGLAAGLDDARKRVETLHERDGTGRGASSGKKLTRRANGRKIRTGAGTVLEEHPLGLRKAEDRFHRVLHRIDEARGALWMFFEADVEPYGAVERRLLINEQVLQIVAERLEVVFAREIVLLSGPRGNRVHDASDELLDAPLALGRTDHAAKILGDNNVGRLLRPEPWNFDVALLEDYRPLLIADDGRPHLPFDLVEWIDSFTGEEPLVLETRDR